MSANNNRSFSELMPTTKAVVEVLESNNLSGLESFKVLTDVLGRIAAVVCKSEDSVHHLAATVAASVLVCWIARNETGGKVDPSTN